MKKRVVDAFPYIPQNLKQVAQTQMKFQTMGGRDLYIGPTGGLA